GDVVVGAAVDALDFLVPGAARGQHEHRHGEPGRAPAAQHGQAVDLGQTEVEHDGVVLLGLAEKISALAVRRAVDGVPRRAQGALEFLGQAHFVFDDENFHGENDTGSNFAQKLYLTTWHRACAKLLPVSFSPQPEPWLNAVFIGGSGTVAYAGARELGPALRARRAAGPARHPPDANRRPRRDWFDWRRHRRQRHGLLMAAGLRVSAVAGREARLPHLPGRASCRSGLVPWRVLARVWGSATTAAGIAGSLCVPHGAVQPRRGGPNRTAVRTARLGQLLH